MNSWSSGKQLLAVLGVGSVVWMTFLFAVAFLNSWLGGGA